MVQAPADGSLHRGWGAGAWGWYARGEAEDYFGGCAHSSGLLMMWMVGGSLQVFSLNHWVEGEAIY